jgi:two-component system, chemotaxis family, response regulator PixH
MAARILVIEDNLPLLTLYNDLFQDEGYDVILQSTPQLDLAQIAEAAPDLIVLDLLFDGDLRGWETLQALKLQAATANIPVVICSAATKSIDDLQSTFASMGAHFLKKPFELETLLDVVQRLLDANSRLSQPLTT